jgi:hypothetical protein
VRRKFLKAASVRQIGGRFQAVAVQAVAEMESKLLLSNRPLVAVIQRAPLELFGFRRGLSLDAREDAENAEGTSSPPALSSNLEEREL